jgi:hypothetical protein
MAEVFARESVALVRATGPGALTKPANHRISAHNAILEIVCVKPAAIAAGFVLLGYFAIDDRLEQFD